ncbi:ABC transporter substrate-binding protein [Carbonactinospora thermoautotrophica]|nr:extracellular solute-binding protein [Carbonactinospora thermoautotrophica]
MRRGMLSIVLGLALAATACGGSGDSGGSGGAQQGGALQGQRITVAAVWTGAEQDNFKKVLQAFEEKTGAKAEFLATGDNVSTFIGTKIQGGQAPDVVMVPQVGVLQQFARNGWLVPLSADVAKEVDANYAKVWKDLGTVDGKFYGLYFKVANKSTIWYNTQAFQNAGVQPPKTWDEFVRVSQQLADAGTAPMSIGAADGWVLTDWFENVYLSQAGPQKYDQLAKHEIKWTDPSVTKALQTLAELWSKPNFMPGGPQTALQVEFPDSVSQVFSDEPKAAMVYEGDFVAGNIATTGKKVGQDANFFPFPAAPGGSQAPLVSAGDAAVVLKAGKNQQAAQEFVKFLATPDAAKVWATAGGFLSPNKKLDASAYPDDVTRQIAKQLIDAGDAVRFDMSDQAPAAFGGTKGAGEWKILQDFLGNLSDVQGAVQTTAQRLEQEATKAYGS